MSQMTATTQRRPPVTVTLTGAAGQIGYALLFRIASGAMLGADVPVRLRLLEVPAAVSAAAGVAMELDDCALPLLDDVEVTDDATAAFSGTNLAILVGSRPRTAGMERRDLLEANAGIFAPQGKAINAGAASDVRVLVVGNPANTNALITASHAPDVPGDRFAALTRLDHNRAVAQLAHRGGVSTDQVRRVTIWGNHSQSQYPDIFHAQVAGRPGREFAADRTWLTEDFIPTVAERGAAIIAARGASSAASAANAILDHMREWTQGTRVDDWVSVGLLSAGEYQTPSGVFCSFPATSDGQRWAVVPHLEIDEFSRQRIDASAAELLAERDAVRALGLI